MKAARSAPATITSAVPATHHRHHERSRLSGTSGGSGVPGGPAGTLDASVLTFILVVVLGGGVALLAISLAESSQPATEPAEPDVGDPVEEDRGAPVDPPPGAIPEPVPPVEEPVPFAIEPAPVEPTLVDTGEGERYEPVRRRHRGSVPKEHTAVEGRFADVAGAPMWRRVLSLLGIVAITIAFGVASAAVLGALIAAVAQLAGDAIG